MKEPTLNIRTARIETDLPDIVRIINPYEFQPLTVDQVRSFFEYNPLGRIQLRLVATDERGAVRGYSGFVHEASAAAGSFVVWVVVDPDYRRQGIASALWNLTLDRLKDYGATRLVADVFDNDPVGLAYAGRRAFKIERHAFYSSLDLTGFDETPYLPGIAALEAGGIRFCSLADFPDTAETRHKLHDLNVGTELDIPGANGVPRSYQDFENSVFNAPWFRPDGQLLAVDGDTWVGLAAVSLTGETTTAHNGYTGVARHYRGKGIARALKVMAARYAIQHGASEIGTDNDSLNEPILAINRSMGYRANPGKYILVRQLRQRGQQG